MAEIDKRYKRGKIYTIRCRYDDSLIYVGSTIDTLAKRMGSHRKTTDYRATSLYHMVKGDWDNWYIELYENYPCNNKQELERREGQVIREIGTINKCIVGRTQKEYYLDNRDELLKKKKENYQKNRDEILENMKDYYKNNRDEILENVKEYYQNNREKILERDKEKTKCNICNCEITKHHLKRHQQSKKCMNYNLNNN